MSTTKFETVYFKPLKLDLFYKEGYGDWYGQLNYANSHVVFEDQDIEENIHLFDVTYSVRKYIHGAYYKVKIKSNDENYEPARYSGHTKGFYTTDGEGKYLPYQIFKIGEEIKL